MAQIRLFLEISSMRGFNLSSTISPGSPSSSGNEDVELGADLITRTAKVRAIARCSSNVTSGLRYRKALRNQEDTSRRPQGLSEGSP